MAKPRWSELAAEFGLDWPAGKTGPEPGPAAPPPRPPSPDAEATAGGAAVGLVEGATQADRPPSDDVEEEPTGRAATADEDPDGLDELIDELGWKDEMSAGATDAVVVSEERAGLEAILNELTGLAEVVTPIGSPQAGGLEVPAGEPRRSDEVVGRLEGRDELSEEPVVVPQLEVDEVLEPRGDGPGQRPGSLLLSEDADPAEIGHDWSGADDRFADLGSNVAHAMRVAYGAVAEMKRLDQRLAALLEVHDSLRKTLVDASEELRRSLAALTFGEDWP